MILVACAVLPLLVLLVADGFSDRNTTIATAIQRFQLQATLAAERQSRIFDDAEIVLNNFRTTPGVDVGGGTACEQAAVRLANANSQFMTIGVTQPDGLITCHNILRNRQMFNDAPLIRAIVDQGIDELTVGDLFIGRVTKRPTIVAAMPLRKGEPRSGVVFAAIDLDKFSHIADLSAVGDADSAVVLDALTGKIIGGSGQSRSMVGTVLDNPALLQALRAKSDGVGGDVSLFGQDDVFAFTPLKVGGLSRLMIVVGGTRRVILAESNQDAGIRMAVALGVSGLALFAAWLIGIRGLAAPIGRLTRTAERIGAGELAARASIAPWQAQELKLLGGTLNGMAERLSVATEQLEDLANRDPLTSLANRRRFDAAVAMECRRSARDGLPLSLLIIDIDAFKAFNDLYGHLAGDEVLRQVGEALRDCARRSGDLAARYGGEEFVLILPNTSEAVCRIAAEAARAAIRELGVIHSGAPAGALTASVGAATAYGAEFVAPEVLFKHADDALYAAKAAGRDRCRFVVVPEVGVGAAKVA